MQLGNVLDEVLSQEWLSIFPCYVYYFNFYISVILTNMYIALQEQLINI
jgi:hypothetical protein